MDATFVQSSKQTKNLGHRSSILETCNTCYLHKRKTTKRIIYIDHNSLTMKISLILLVPFVSVTFATKGFIYNDDIVCGYPFEDLVIASITCTPSTYIDVLPDGGTPANIYDSHDVCAFGNQMDIIGQVTSSQVLTRNYNVNLKACFRTSDISWYSAKKCMLFKTTLDLRTSVEQALQEQEQADAAAAEGVTQATIDYVEPGVYTFSARVIIPKKTFVFKPGTISLDFLAW
jgi:hypothetical protein